METMNDPGEIQNDISQFLATAIATSLQAQNKIKIL